MCRTVHRAHKRLLNTYLQPYPGYYFTGDGAYRDADGHYWITGRVDDTLNVSGTGKFWLRRKPAERQLQILARAGKAKGLDTECRKDSLRFVFLFFFVK